VGFVEARVGFVVEVGEEVEVLQAEVLEAEVEAEVEVEGKNMT
jgi:hypothetical protein